MSTDEPHEIPIVLVVEDEVLIREDVIDVLEQSGFDALRAANAEDALSVLAAHPDIRAVFTDIEMPGSSRWPRSRASSGSPAPGYSGAGDLGPQLSPHRTTCRRAPASCRNLICR